MSPKCPECPFISGTIWHRVKLRIRKLRKRGKIRWCLDLRSVKGGRKFFDSKDAAETHAWSVSIEVKNFGASALSLTHAERVEFLTAKQRLPPGRTLTEVIDFYLEHRRQITHRKISEALEEVILAKKSAGKRHSYLLALRSSCKMLKIGIGDIHADAVTAPQIEAWLNSKRYATATRRTMLIDISTFFEFCVKRGYATANPVKKIERVVLDDKPPGILTVDQCARLLTTCQRVDPALLDFLAVQLFGGLRPSEARRLKAEDIRDGHINIVAQTKVRKRRLVTINETLRAWMNSPPKLRAVNSKRRLDAVRKAAQPLPWPHDCLRHTAASMMLPLLGPAKTSNELGHSESVLFRHYRELVTAGDVKAFWALRP
jgi:integrase